MKTINRLLAFVVILSSLFLFNAYAMNEKQVDGLKISTPQSEKSDDEKSDYRWTWLNDNVCVRFNKGYNKDSIKMQYEIGTLTTWRDRVSENWVGKTRELYSGKWSQSEDGIRSFTFDDCTIPVGVTKIDGVLYAFNTYGELKAGYEYYTGFKTEADGLAKADSAEFTQWLGTQYLPDCTSHE